MKRKKNPSEWMMLLAGIFLFLLLLFVKHRLDLSEERSGAERDTKNPEVQELETQNRTEQNRIETEQTEKKSTEPANRSKEEYAASWEKKSEEKKEAVGEKKVFPVRIRVLLTDCGVRGYYQEEISLRGNAGLSVNDGAYQAGEQETIYMNRAGEDEVIRVCPKDEMAGTALSLSGKKEDESVYPGNFLIYRTPQGLLVVNELDLETYLRYVVPSEMPASYEAEALKAQTICARTYACAKIQEKSMETFHADVDDSVESQVYHKMKPQPETDAAVEDTKGEIMICDGEPIQAYFFSTSCGKTSTDEVWKEGTGERYLKSVTVGEEMDEPQTEEAFAAFITRKENKSLEEKDGWYRWNVTLPVQVLFGRAEEEKIGIIEEITVLSRSKGGAVEKIRITGTNGSMEIHGEYEIRSFLSVEGYPVQKNDGTVSKEMDLLPSACFTIIPQKEKEKVTAFTFYGGGYGHGVGMSQNGAQHLAEQGKTYPEILNYFYQNIEICDCAALF